MYSFLRCNPFILAVPMVFAALLAVGPTAQAQTITGSISGAVMDSSGGMIPGATVTLTSEKTGQSRGSTTNSEGRFNFAALQPGNYALKIERQGFQALEQRGVILSANENLALGELKLQPGQVSETVSVMSEGAIVERDGPETEARLKLPPETIATRFGELVEGQAAEIDYRLKVQAHRVNEILQAIAEVKTHISGRAPTALE